VRVRILLSVDGLLSSFEADGHAGSVGRGSNLACAGATAILRTAGRVCAEKGILVRGSAEERGTMTCAVRPRGPADAEWLRGVTGFLLRGLRDLRDEFPQSVIVDIREAPPGAAGLPSGVVSEDLHGA
jgi:uncharacterized protein YsxB (DUF464 family)